MTKVTAILIEIRKDGMQKWERTDLPKDDHMRYIWLTPALSRPDAYPGCAATLEFIRGTGGSIGGHWAGWKVMTP